MTVPPAAVLRRGVGVNIVLKKDQPTGRLTRGLVADLLSRGNHPRGVKVRLQDGQIGRVQSLVEDGAQPFPASSSSGTPSRELSSNVGVRLSDPNPITYHDYRNDATPMEERSLEDYIKVKPARNKRKAKTPGQEAGNASDAPMASADADVESMRESLQLEFPTLDADLVWSILSDCQSVALSREILTKLRLDIHSPET